MDVHQEESDLVVTAMKNLGPQWKAVKQEYLLRPEDRKSDLACPKAIEQRDKAKSDPKCPKNLKDKFEPKRLDNVNTSINNK